MPQASIAEWVAGGILPGQNRLKAVDISRSNTTGVVQYLSMDDNSDSGCCPTCCNCYSCDNRSETSTDSPSKRVRFKHPKGILKHSRKAKKEEHRCCSACTSSVHCNERHTVGKNGRIYRSSKKCVAKDRKKDVNGWGEYKIKSNSPQRTNDESNYNYTGKRDLYAVLISICGLTKLYSLSSPAPTFTSPNS